MYYEFIKNRFNHYCTYLMQKLSKWSNEKKKSLQMVCLETELETLLATELNRFVTKITLSIKFITMY